MNHAPRHYLIQSAANAAASCSLSVLGIMADSQGMGPVYRCASGPRYGAMCLLLIAGCTCERYCRYQGHEALPEGEA
jgi:hypothetical protein